MKVLQICAYAARYGGNFIASLSVLEAQLQAQGIRTEYLFPETARDMPWCKALQGRTKVHFASLNRFSPQTYRQIAGAMEGADIVHSHFELYDCLTALAKKKGQKLFWHLHDSFEETIDLPHRLINRLQYGVLGKRARLISPSEYYADYVAKLGFPKKQIHYVPNAIDFSRLRRESGREKEYDFLIFGGFYRIKGLDILLDACRLLSRKGLLFRIGLVGYPDTWKYVDENYGDLTDCVIRLEPNEDVSRFYQKAGAFLSASRRECFSYAVLEALYMGLPAVISRIPGNRWAYDYPSTLVFPSEDAKALADAMERRLTGDEWCTEEDLEMTARDVSERYAAQSWAMRIKEIYTRE